MADRVQIRHPSGRTRQVPAHVVGYWADRGWEPDEDTSSVSAPSSDVTEASGPQVEEHVLDETLGSEEE